MVVLVGGLTTDISPASPLPLRVHTAVLVAPATVVSRLRCHRSAKTNDDLPQDTSLAAGAVTSMLLRPLLTSIMPTLPILALLHLIPMTSTLDLPTTVHTTTLPLTFLPPTLRIALLLHHLRLNTTHHLHVMVQSTRGTVLIMEGSTTFDETTEPEGHRHGRAHHLFRRSRFLSSNNSQIICRRAAQVIGVALVEEMIVDTLVGVGVVVGVEALRVDSMEEGQADLVLEMVPEGMIDGKDDRDKKNPLINCTYGFGTSVLGLA